MNQSHQYIDAESPDSPITINSRPLSCTIQTTQISDTSTSTPTPTHITPTQHSHNTHPEKTKEKEKEPTEETQLTNSWVDIIEEEVGNHKETKTFAYSGGDKEKTPDTPQDTTQDPKVIDIDQITTLKCNQVSDLELLEYQTFVSGYLRKHIKQIGEFNTEEDTAKFIKRLNWLMDVSKYLSDKTGLPFYNHKESESKKELIQRSSYKFCNYNFECEFNYNLKKYSGCYAQHYVHNLVYADIKAVRDCMLSVNNGNSMDKNTVEEIKKSINTISFVINHMFDEFKNVSFRRTITKNKSKRTRPQR